MAFNFRFHLEHIQSLVLSLVPKIIDSLIDECSDELIGDFVMHRLPPPDIPATEEFFDDEKEGLLAEMPQNEKMQIQSPTSIFSMIQNVDGVKTLAMAHNRNNNRLAHMNHPSSEDYLDDESSKSSQGSSGYDGGEGGDDDDDDDDEGPWELHLPYRYDTIPAVY